MIIDQSLVARAQAKAGGQNVHQMANIITTYYGYVELNMVEDAERLEAILRIFISTGKLPPRDR